MRQTLQPNGSALISTSDAPAGPVDLPEQQHFWTVTSLLGAGVHFHTIPWGHTQEGDPWPNYDVPRLTISCKQPKHLSFLIGIPTLDYYRSVDIIWKTEGFLEAFNGAEIITEFKRVGRDSTLRGDGHWHVRDNYTLENLDAENFVKKARESWLLEVRMYRQGLPAGSFHYDLRGLANLMDREHICQR